MADQIQAQPPQQASQPQQEVPVPKPQPQVEDDEKFFAAIGYLGPLFVVSLIAKPKSVYCKFHAMQSAVLLVFFFLFLIILGFISRWIGSLLFFPLFAVYVIAIYRAHKGELWNIPVVSNFAEKINVESLYSKAGLAVSGISGLKEKAEGMASKAGEAVKTVGKQEEGPAKEEPQALPPQK